jgi:hypothetical protein
MARYCENDIEPSGFIRSGRGGGGLVMENSVPPSYFELKFPLWCMQEFGALV